MKPCCKQIFSLAIAEVLLIIETNKIETIDTLKATLSWALDINEKNREEESKTC